MRKFENVILASDIDGTLLLNDYVHPRNIERIQYFTTNGGKFLLASGRNSKELPIITPELLKLVNAPCVLSNGGVSFNLDTGELENPVYLNNDDLITLIQDVEEHYPQVGYRSSYSNGFVIREYDKYIGTTFSNPSLIKQAVPTSLEGMRKFNVFKGVFIQEPPLIDEIVDYAIKHFSNRFVFTKSSQRILEVQPIGIEKSFQLKYIKEKYKKENPNIEVWCIGDYDNDIGLLKMADVSACPANSTASVMAIANHHVCHCNDGAVADFIDIMDKK